MLRRASRNPAVERAFDQRIDLLLTDAAQDTAAHRKNARQQRRVEQDERPEASRFLNRRQQRRDRPKRMPDGSHTGQPVRAQPSEQIIRQVCPAMQALRRRWGIPERSRRQAEQTEAFAQWAEHREVGLRRKAIGDGDVQRHASAAQFEEGLGH